MSIQAFVAGGSLLLLAARPPSITAISLSDMSETLLVADCGGAPAAIALDLKHKHVYWANRGSDRSRNDGVIVRVDLDGTNRVEIVKRGETFAPDQIAVDGEHGYLYWADREGMRVMRSRLDGTEIAVLIQTGETVEHCTDERRHCVGVAIDPTDCHLFWSQKNSPGSRHRQDPARRHRPSAGADQRNRSDIEVVLARLPEPTNLEWDGRNGFLYWTDRGYPPLGGTLNRAKFLDGRLVEPEILLSSREKGIRLALDAIRGCAFVSNLGGSIRMMRLERPGESEVIFSRPIPLIGIAHVPAFDLPDAQPRC